MSQACASAMSATGKESGSSASRTAAVATKGTEWATVVVVQVQPAPAQALGVEPRAPVDGRGLRQGGARRAHPPAIGRRRMTSSASSGSSRTCSAWPSPVLTTA